MVGAAEQETVAVAVAATRVEAQIAPRLEFDQAAKTDKTDTHQRSRNSKNAWLTKRCNFNAQCFRIPEIALRANEFQDN
eukprot:3276147-Lingulodinium_polyedra.AAC.1